MSDFGEQFLIDVVMNSQNADPWLSTVAFGQWKPSVLRELQKLASTQCGLILLNAIRQTGKFCAIIPPEPEIAAGCNSRTIGSFPAGPVDLASPSKHRLYHAAVEFDPSQYKSGSLCYRNKHFANPAFNRSALPNEVLFHELFHAWRHMTGLVDHSTVVDTGLNALYNNTEEFLAVTITNIYVSDHTNRWASGLRADHVSHRPLEKNLSTSVRFFQSSPQVLPILREFARQAGDLCREICNVRSSFNPIAAVMDPSLTSLLNQLSQSPTAQQRDAWMPVLVPIAKILAPSPPTPQFEEALEGIAKDLATEALAVLRAVR